MEITTHNTLDELWSIPKTNNSFLFSLESFNNFPISCAIPHDKTETQRWRPKYSGRENSNESLTLYNLWTQLVKKVSLAATNVNIL